MPKTTFEEGENLEYWANVSKIAKRDTNLFAYMVDAQHTYPARSDKDKVSTDTIESILPELYDRMFEDDDELSVD